MKIQVLQNTMVITSALKVSDIEELAVYNRKQLALVDSENNEIFTISFNNGCGNISKYGITFDSSNTEGYAIISGRVETEEGVNIKTAIAKNLRDVLVNLPKLEAQISDFLVTFAAETAELENNIEILG